ncbi:MAG TPA: outer membrane beta-barrel protein [Candidatus Binataceae bacterium]|nr:outer membrane beta-barrel protein [Candidatus Binataceae bacterium]
MEPYTSLVTRIARVLAATLLAFGVCGRLSAWAQSTATVTPPAAGAPATAAPAPAAAPTPIPPLTTPAVTGPLQFASPTPIDLSAMTGLSDVPVISDLGKFDINGVVSGIGIVQDHATASDRTDRADVSNAMIMIQKAEGPVQFYLQAGAYDLPALGAPFISAGTALNSLYGPLPVAYLKLAPSDNFSVMAGNLPTLIGAEYTFTFENMNIERGLLWNQENAINRGVQLNYSLGPVSTSLSWSNGFYSNSYTWLIGSLAYAINSANAVSVVGGGNLGFSKFSNFATSAVLNNSQIYNLIYTYNSSPWIVQPYVQWTYVPSNDKIGVAKSTSTIGGAILASYALTDNFFLAARAEYIGSTGSPTDGSVNLLYGPGSEAWSLTLTPTYQYKKFFVRGEVSFVQAMSYVAGSVFGGAGRNPAQVRGVLETGLLL